ncbi:MAG: hypothetical protein R6V04_01665 [bacterium]
MRSKTGVLKRGVKEGELLTYKKLQIIGIDTVRIDKFDNLEYEINFLKLETFEKFKNLHHI